MASLHHDGQMCGQPTLTKSVASLHQWAYTLLSLDGPHKIMHPSTCLEVGEEDEEDEKQELDNEEKKIK